MQVYVAIRTIALSIDHSFKQVKDLIFEANDLVFPSLSVGVFICLAGDH